MKHSYVDWIGNDYTDNAAAVARDVAIAAVSGWPLDIPPGVYRSSQPFSFGRRGIRVAGHGRVVLKYIGSAPYCLTVDNGPESFGYDVRIENLTIEGSGAQAQSGFYQRNFVHGSYADIRVRNVTGAAFELNGDVCSEYARCVSSINEGDMLYTPSVGILARGSDICSDTTACTFSMPIIEGMRDIGLDAVRMANCTILGGTFEGGRGLGLRLGVGAVENTMHNLSCEANALGDALILGRMNELRGGYYSSRAASNPYESVNSIVVGDGATLNKINKVRAYTIRVVESSKGTEISGCDVLYRIIDDASRATLKGPMRQLYYSGDPT